MLYAKNIQSLAARLKQIRSQNTQTNPFTNNGIFYIMCEIKVATQKRVLLLCDFDFGFHIPSNSCLKLKCK